MLVAANGLKVAVKLGCGLFSMTSVLLDDAFEPELLLLELEQAAAPKATMPTAAIPARVLRSIIDSEQGMVGDKPT